MSTLKTANIQHPSLSTASVVVNGTTGEVTFPNGGGSAYTLLASGNLSGSTVTLNNIAGTYVDLYVIVADVVQSSTPNACYIQFNSAANVVGGTTYWTGLNYKQNTDSYLYLSASNSSVYMNGTGANAFAFRISNYAGTAKKPLQMNGAYKYSTDTDNSGVLMAGMCTLTSAITRIDIVTSGSTFSAGSYKIYGVK